MEVVNTEPSAIGTAEVGSLWVASKIDPPLDTASTPGTGAVETQTELTGADQNVLGSSK